MVDRTLRLTREQIAKIVDNDPDAIRQFERLFATTESNSTSTTVLEGLAQLAATAPANPPLETLPVETIDWRIFPRFVPQQGRMGWEPTDGTLALGMNGNVLHRLGLNTFARIANNTGGSFAAGELVAFNGSPVGGVFNAVKFIADGTIAAERVLGFVAAPVANGGQGFAVSFGPLDGLNTASFSAGDMLYASATTAGAWTTTPPSSPNITLFIGAILSVSTTEGRLWARMGGGASAGGGGGGGTVTSVSGAGTVNGITLTGTVTTSGSLTLGGTLSGVDLATQTTGTLGLSRGGTGQTAAPAALDAVSGITSTAFGRSTLTWADAAAGRSALGVTATGGDTTYLFRTNNLSDLASASTSRTNLGATTVGDAVFTAANAAAARSAIGAGTVTSVGGTGTVNGLTLTGTVTGSGNLTLGGTLSGISLATQTTGTLALARGGTGQTTAPQALDAVSGVTSTAFGRASLAYADAAAARTAIGAGVGSVTSVAGTGTVNGITLTGTVTSSGNITLGGALSGVDLATQTTGTLAIGRGGTGLTATPTNGQLPIGNGSGFSLATITAGPNITVTNSAGGITIAATGLAGGTVTSVDVAGGTTGLTFSGGPITSSGTITMAGTLAIANGGTGATTTGAALTNLGAVPTGAITSSGLTMATARLLGRTTASTGAIEEITVGSGLSFTGGVLSSTAGGGSVTSVDVSGGTTGLSFTGGPITGAGTITMSGTLDLDNGGTGQTAAPAALDAVSGVTSTSFGRTSLTYADAAAARTAIGVSATGADPTYLVKSANLGDLTSASAARANLSLGGLALLNTINNGNWSGTALSISNGGTGQNTASAAMDALLPSQTGNAGRALVTNGTTHSWGTPDMGFTRAQLAAASGVDGEPRYLIDSFASGWFVWRAGDYSAEVAADTLEGIYIEGSVAATSGAWVRDWDWVNGKPEWFGAEPGNGSFDCLPALEACVLLCPVTLLQLDDYWISDTWIIDTDWREVRGCGFVSYGQFEGTRILLADGSKPIVQIGPTTDLLPPAVNPQTDYLKQVRFSRASLVRAATIIPNAIVDNNPAAMVMQYTYQCHVSWVAGWESAIGFRLYANVASKLDDCWYFRSAAATTTVNDVALGFLCIGDPPVFTGGNASLYMNRCKANLAGTLSTSPPAISAGFRSSGSICDLFFVQPETTGFTHGIWLSGNGSGGAAGSNINVHCIAGIFDQPVDTCVRVEDINPNGCVEFVDCYGGLPGTAFAAVYISGGSGTVKLNGGQFSCASGTANTLGLYVQNQTGFVCRDTVINNSPRPVFMDNSDNFELSAAINNPTVSISSASGAIVLDSCDVGHVACQLKGSGTPFNTGVWLNGTGNSRIEVNCTRLNPANISGGSANKLVNNSVQITATGTFNTNCFASGVMG